MSSQELAILLEGSDLAAAVEPDRSDLLGGQQVGHPETRLGRVGVQLERAVRLAQGPELREGDGVVSRDFRRPFRQFFAFWRRSISATTTDN